MSAPLNTDEPTGSPKRLAALLLILLIIGGTLFYASRLQVAPTSETVADMPQVQGAETTTPDNTPGDTQPSTTPAANIPSTTYKIVATVDGDTVKASIDGKTETIRLIGVDTPETKDPRKKVQCFGKQASEYTHTALFNKNVRLAADDTQDNRDKYGRLLRYIFLEDGTNFNQALIANGYAYEYTYDIPYRYQAQFKAAQAAAQKDNKGLWAPETCNGTR